MMVNQGATSVDLSGWALSSTPPLDEPDLWTFPAGTIVAPEDALVVYWHTPTDTDIERIVGISPTVTAIATGKDFTSLFNNDGGDLALLDPTGTSIHYVQWSKSGMGLEAAAVAAGVWTESSTLERPGEGQWLLYDGEGYEVEDWSIETIVESHSPTAVSIYGWSDIKREGNIGTRRRHYVHSYGINNTFMATRKK